MFERLFKGDKQKDFWQWFTKNQIELFHFEDNQEVHFNQLSKKLKDVDAGLTFEFGPIRDHIREFCISADGIQKLFPVVIALVEKAPDLQIGRFMRSGNVLQVTILL